jgi:hypothetical protein
MLLPSSLPRANVRGDMLSPTVYQDTTKAVFFADPAMQRACM